MNFAASRGAPVVAAAGNGHTSRPVYPAAYPRAIAVSATGTGGNFAGFSNRSRWVDVAVPGVSIVSTVPGGYARGSGTSYSAPHVSGLFGLLAQKGVRGNAARYRVMGGATDLGTQGDDPLYGMGRVDAEASTR